MKKNRGLIILLVVLIAVAAYFFFTQTSGTIKNELQDFAIEDTASITKVFIADAEGQQVTLTKSDRGWLVNNTYFARPDNIQLILTTFNRIDIKSPVSKAAFDNVVKNIATTGTKVEIYQENKDLPSKIYYIGGATMDHQGTYMLLEKNGEKSSVPFITHIPGFYGYLSNRFFAEEQLWRDVTIFKYHPDQIKEVVVEYPDVPEQSFKIEKNVNEIKLYSYPQNTNIQGADTSRLADYLYRFEKVSFEMVDMESTQQFKDSVIASVPKFIIKVVDVTNIVTEVKAFNMPNFRELKNHDGSNFSYDVDRMYGLINDKDFVYIQFATFDKLTIPAMSFVKKPSL